MTFAKSILALATAALITTGCGGLSWPPEGQGGWAEHPRLAALPDDDPVSIAKQRLAQITWDGGVKLFPGRLAEVRTLLTRAERERVGGFQQDVTNTLISVEAALDDLEQRLSAR